MTQRIKADFEAAGLSPENARIAALAVITGKINHVEVRYV